MPKAPEVVAVTATFRRPAELERLIRSLENSTSGLRALIIIDNSADPAVRRVAESTAFPHVYHAPGENLGCGGGLHAGENLALARFPECTHLWILDDDCAVEPGTLATLLAAVEAEQADAAHPLTQDSEGFLSWFPGLLDPAKFRTARQRPTPEHFLTKHGSKPVPFSWSQGIALLVTRRALDELGPHRTDYWVRGEDLEFTLRITARYRGIYVPAARVWHLPPPGSGDLATEYPKHAAMLRNLAYTSLRLKHGRRIARTLPGNWLRFLRTWGFSPRNLWAILAATSRGVLIGPAGR